VGEHDNGWTRASEGQCREGEQTVGEDDVSVAAGSTEDGCRSYVAPGEQRGDDRSRTSRQLQLWEPHPVDTEIVELNAEGTVGRGAAH
jgi:hypothetical protein